MPELDWNACLARLPSPAHPGVIDRLFIAARGGALWEEQFAALNVAFPREP